MRQLSNFINGTFAPPAGGVYLDNWNPATGEVAGRIPDSGKADIDAAVAAARAAFPAWSRMPLQQRSKMLLRVADLLEARAEEFARAESEDQGKPVSLARTVDMPRAVLNFRFFATAILHHREEATDIDGQAFNYTQRRPLGVCGLISPWNLPLYLLTWKIAPAIAVGNTCVAKPSEMTPMTAFLLGEVLQEAGLPAGVVNIVHGLGGKAGQALVEHPDVPLISFTGGCATGEMIQKSAAPLCKKLGLELGGKNPNLIFDDADLAQCVPTSIRAAFANQGEICLCGSRIFVQQGIYDKFVAAFVNQAKALVVGDPASETTNLGPLVSAAHRDKVLSYIELAKREGGTIAAGGSAPAMSGKFAGGFFLNPTVITGLGPQCRVLQEEIFGPVVTITPFQSEDEAVAWANGVKYGLSASVWTRELSRGHRVAQALDAGVVWVNAWMLRDIRTPFGGVKASGLGREGGEYSIDFYTEQKTICVKI